MDYVIGIDGGGTKTDCVLADSFGNVLFSGYGRCSNHQICGIDAAVATISELIQDAITRSGINVADIRMVMMGLAGADFKDDVDKLYISFSRSLPDLKFMIVNDIWIAFESEVRENWGAISICGTGHNAAVRTRDGRIVGIRALKYALGNYGGGRFLTDNAFHWAFRSNEHTGPYTLLEKYLPQYCRVSDMDHLAEAVYRSGYSFQYQYNIPKLVFRLADKGDTVCCNLVCHMGKELGTILGGLIEKAGLCDDIVPVVLGGSLYINHDGERMLNSFYQSLGRRVPNFEPHLLKSPPVYGAVCMGFRKVGIHLEKQALLRNLVENRRNEGKNQDGKNKFL